MVRSLLTEVGVVVGVATFVVAWNSLLVGGWRDFAGVLHEPLLGAQPFLLLELPSLPFTLAATSLGLLLVFRTNACYGRWLEARVVWGRILSQSRNIVRQASVWDTATGEERAR